MFSFYTELVNKKNRGAKEDASIDREILKTKEPMTKPNQQRHCNEQDAHKNLDLERPRIFLGIGRSTSIDGFACIGDEQQVKRGQNSQCIENRQIHRGNSPSKLKPCEGLVRQVIF
jgi:hypothetical protein